MTDGKSRYLVAHDYVGALWWWVRARSAMAIVETCAEVEVVTYPGIVHHAHAWDLQVIDLDADNLGPLESLRAKRDTQREHPGSVRLSAKR